MDCEFPDLDGRRVGADNEDIPFGVGDFDAICVEQGFGGVGDIVDGLHASSSVFDPPRWPSGRTGESR